MSDPIQNKEYLLFLQKLSDLANMAEQRDKQSAALAKATLVVLEEQAKRMGITVVELVEKIVNGDPSYGTDIQDFTEDGLPITAAQSMRRTLAEIKKELGKSK